MIDYSKLTDREIDAAIAKRVMGWVKVCLDNRVVTCYKTNKEELIPEYAFHPTTDHNDMMLVMEKMIEQGWSPVIECCLFCEKKWFVKFINFDAVKKVHASANTLPRAVCEAALKVVEAADD